jgi:hypothetical protein
MRLPVQVVLDTDNDRLLFETPAAAGEGDVIVLTIDLKQLSADDKRRLRHIRPQDQAQRLPGTTPVTRG